MNRTDLIYSILRTSDRLEELADELIDEELGVRASLVDRLSMWSIFGLAFFKFLSWFGFDFYVGLDDDYTEVDEETDAAMNVFYPEILWTEEDEDATPA